jgi:LysM repeat protein
MRRSLVALALAVTLPLPVLAGQVSVKEGETLSQIAERHGISLSRLMQINGIRDADQVEAGRTLTIPGSSGGGSAQGSRAAAGSVTVKEGETLSELAERHGVSLSRLMQINGIRNADQVVAGQTLKLGSAAQAPTRTVPASTASGTVTVKSGETLSELAERHGLSLNQLMEINGIRNADQVVAGQTLKLRGATQAPARTASAATPTTPSYPRGATEHVVRPGESLSAIASGYGIGMSKLIAINGISDPDHVETGTRLKLKGAPPSDSAPATRPAVTTAISSASAHQPSHNPQISRPAPASTAPSRPASSVTRPSTSTPVISARPTASAATAAAPQAAAATSTTVAMASAPDWRTYGPLQVNWAAWQPMGGSMVAPTLNNQGQTLYLAINCGARKFNSTTPSGEWQSWNDPSGDYEQQLVSDYCRSRS